MQRITRIIVTIAGGLIPTLLFSFSSGPDPRKTGAPGDLTCAQAGCHSGTALNGGGGSAVLISSAGSTYAPGQQQTLTLSITDSSARVYGFQVTARLDSNPTNGQAGDFTAGASQFVICDNGSLKGAGGCPTSAPVQFIEHSTPSSAKTILITWTAPSTDQGAITFYAAANAANGDRTNFGDHIYTTKLTLTPAASSANRPSITSVQSASAFNAAAGIAPGTWIEVFGTNLAPATRTWAGDDFKGSDAPISLDGVGVTIGGKHAYISYISPVQVNAQVPEGITISANVPLVLETLQGRSDNFALQTTDLAPALLAPASFAVNGRQYAVATLDNTDTDGAAFVGAKDSIRGVNTRPARFGEIITLYGIGFGTVTPASSPGSITADANQLTRQLILQFGETQAKVAYAGLAPGLVGLYQFNVEVPNVPAGDSRLRLQLDGVTLNQSLFLTIGQ
jgi:uncharacterized protein (TIGR03437 family)